MNKKEEHVEIDALIFLLVVLCLPFIVFAGFLALIYFLFG